jgi:serine protease Do
MKKFLLAGLLLLNILILGQVNGIIPRLNGSNSSLSRSQLVSPARNFPQGDNELWTINAINSALPSVVTVGISQTVSNYSLEFDPSNPFRPFRRVPGATHRTEQNIGSGFIVKSDGIILTNRHVVSDTSASYFVITNDKKKYNVTQIYRDSANDLALLKINPPAGGLKPLPLGDSSNLKLGQTVIAIGTPLGEFTNTVTEGIISGLGRGITAGSLYEGYVEKLDNVIQTDAAINPGNSGGPLLDLNGEVIGINAAIASQGQNIGFAIPVTIIKNFLLGNHLG